MDNQVDLGFYTKTGAKIFFVAGAYILFGATIYRLIEGFTWVDSFYFVVVTLSTIGYGDITPKTTDGKIFTIFFIIIGVAIFSTLITNIVARSKERRRVRLAKKPD